VNDRFVYMTGALGAALAAFGFISMPGLEAEPTQGAVAKLLLLCGPMAVVAALSALVAMLASVSFLARRDFRFDSWAVAATEVGLTFLAGSLAVGAVWGRVLSGRWWNWDAPLTSALACWLLYAGYLILRAAVEEPTQRAVFSAAFSIFAFIDIPIVVSGVRWWGAVHPEPVLWEGMRPLRWEWVAAVNAAGMALLAAAFMAARMRQEEQQRELDSLRRTLHAF
jgi:heme exporter protein C